MYTKEDIEKAKQYLDNEGYGTGSNFTLNVVANLMAEYSAKNCVIPAVINRRELLIDFCKSMECHFISTEQNKIETGVDDYLKSINSL